MDAVQRVAVALIEIERPRAERIVEAAGHPAAIFFKLRLPRDHLRRRRPCRPLRLAPDGRDAVPAETLAADADAVTDRLPVADDERQEIVRGIDDDRARLLVAVIGDRLPEIARIDQGDVDGRNGKRLVGNLCIHVGDRWIDRMARDRVRRPHRRVLIERPSGAGGGGERREKNEAAAGQGGDHDFPSNRQDATSVEHPAMRDDDRAG
ncbi:MAG: hypothetical protein BGP06_17995 [Rhizobiales bacterium 65-9]|nr:MAG: hypothetical protein BGP06_17995 [Rhizobiales bacterium 65-9]